MKLDRTLTSTWVLRGSDVPALAATASRAHVVVVDDVEYLCAAIVREIALSRAVYAPKTYAQMDDLLAFLIGQVAIVVPSYDPTRGNQVHDPYTAGFRAWLYVELKRDTIDECRSRFGRNGQKHDLIDLRPFQQKEDAERAAQLDEADPNEDSIRSFADRLVETLEGVAVDDPDDWFHGRGWTELRGHRKAQRAEQAVGLGTPRRAPEGDRGPGGRPGTQPAVRDHLGEEIAA